MRAHLPLRRMQAVLPTSKTPRSAAPEAKTGQIPVGSVSSKATDGEARAPKDPLEPIGPERLKALREAIRNGTYPSEEQVLGGLERLFAAE